MTDSFYHLDSFGTGNSLGYLLRRATKLSSSLTESLLSGREISFTQWVVLALVYSGTATTCTELSRNLGHDSGAMSRLVDQLSEHQLLERKPDPGDRRVVRLTATAAGEAITRDITRQVMNFWNELLAAFERTEIDQLIDTLNRLVGTLEALETQTEVAK